MAISQPPTGLTGTEVPLYSVKTVANALVFDASGNTTDGYRVTFEVAGAGEQYLEVPASQFSFDNISNLIASRTALIVSVLEIQGPPVELDASGHPILPA